MGCCHRQSAPLSLHSALVLFLLMYHGSRGTDSLMQEQPAVIFHGSVISLENVATTTEVVSESRSTRKDLG